MHLCIFWFFSSLIRFSFERLKKLVFWEIADVGCTLGVLGAWRYREQARSHSGGVGDAGYGGGSVVLIWLVLRYREQARSHRGCGVFVMAVGQWF